MRRGPESNSCSRRTRVSSSVARVRGIADWVGAGLEEAAPLPEFSTVGRVNPAKKPSGGGVFERVEFGSGSGDGFAAAASPTGGFDEGCGSSFGRGEGAAFSEAIATLCAGAGACGGSGLEGRVVPFAGVAGYIPR